MNGHLLWIVGQVTLKKKSKGNDRGSHTFVWESSIPGRRKATRKGPQEREQAVISGMARIKEGVEWGE